MRLDFIKIILFISFPCLAAKTAADLLADFKKDNAALLAQCGINDAMRGCKSKLEEMARLQTKADEEAKLRKPAGNSDKAPPSEAPPEEETPTEKPITPDEPRAERPVRGPAPVVVRQVEPERERRDNELRNRQNEMLSVQRGLGHVWAEGIYPEAEVTERGKGDERIEVFKKPNGGTRLRIWADSYERATEIYNDWKKANLPPKKDKTPEDGTVALQNGAGSKTTSADGASITNNVNVQINSGYASAQSQSRNGEKENVSGEENDIAALLNKSALFNSPQKGGVENEINNDVRIGARKRDGTREFTSGLSEEELGIQPKRRGIASLEEPSTVPTMPERMQKLDRDIAERARSKTWFMLFLVAILSLGASALWFLRERFPWPFIFWKRKKEEDETHQETAVTKLDSKRRR